MNARSSPGKWLRKKAKAGVRAYPVGTVAFYGPDNARASKAAVGILAMPDAEADMRKWVCETGDIRRDDVVLEEVVAYLREQGVRSVAMIDRIIGCPHEEGIDYPEGQSCPQCPYWASRDRWSGKRLDQ